MNTKLIKFQSNVIITLWWRLVNSIKLTRSGDRLGFILHLGTSRLSCISCFVWAAPDPFINLLNCFIMPKQNNNNIVYDSFNDVTWDFSGFFEVLADYYEGKPENMANDLIQAVKTLNLLVNDATFANEIQETSVNLIYVQDAIKAINNE